MATLMVDYFSTLDGFGYGEDAEAYFGLSGPGMFDWISEQTAGDHLMIMGANTYRTMADIVAGQDDPQSVRMAELRKIVFSGTIQPPLSWANTELRREDAVAGVRELKDSESGLIRTIGSLSLSRSLLAAGLVDRIRMMIFPLILGATGRERILDGLPDLDLQLVSARTLDGRLQLLEYAPTIRLQGSAGPHQKGS